MVSAFGHDHLFVCKTPSSVFLLALSATFFMFSPPLGELETTKYFVF